MRKSILKEVVRESLEEYFAGKEGQLLIGRAVYAAVQGAMTAEIEIEDGKSEPGRTVAKKRRVNVLHFLAQYLPGVEAAIRGCQSDAAKAKNRAAQSLAAVERAVEGLAAIERAVPALAAALRVDGPAARLRVAGAGHALEAGSETGPGRAMAATDDNPRTDYGCGLIQLGK